MNIKDLLIWIQGIIIVALVGYIYMSEPKEKIVTKEKVKYKTIVKEKLIEKECKPIILVRKRKNIKTKQEDNILLSVMDTDKKFTIHLMSKNSYKVSDKYEAAMINGFLEEGGEKSYFLMDVNKNLLKNSYFKVKNVKSKDIFISRKCFENIEKSDIYEAKLSIIGGNVFCDVKGVNEEEFKQEAYQDNLYENMNEEEQQNVVKQFVGDLNMTLSELGIQLKTKDINKTKIENFIKQQNIQIEDIDEQTLDEIEGLE